MKELNQDNVWAVLLREGVSFHTDVVVQDSFHTKSKVVVIEVRYHDITFEDLQRVSRALGTTKINVDNQVREEGYCATCRHSYSVTVLTCMDAQLAD